MSEAQKDNVVDEMKETLAKLQASDPTTLAQLADDRASCLRDLPPEERRQQAIQALTDSITVATKENASGVQDFHSRDPLTGIIQSALQDNVVPVLQATGEGNPVVWIPAGIRGILEHFNSKHPFQIATPAASRIQIPDKCKIALLGDWGAPNIHAERLGDLAIAKGADYVIHLGDIYYSGTEPECNTFLQRWPLKGVDGKPLKKNSLALNGNHEMYSLGIPFFDIVLPAFDQEASYFTLFNTHWQFQGLDTAYVPFSISGGNIDARLQVQMDWLLDSIRSNPNKQNIFLTHNQPVSSHLPEFQAAQPLMAEVRTLLEQTTGTAIYAWFFGHEHRCTIYDDKASGALFRARLIGNGSIAHPPQNETAPQGATTPFLKVNSRALDEDDQVAISTFALLTLNDDTIHVDYIDEDDRLFYAEDWNASTKMW